METGKRDHPALLVAAENSMDVAAADVALMRDKGPFHAIVMTAGAGSRNASVAMIN